jgi:ubiquinone biosynthesis UbiH/UbiF/VisC/COQ6 family hydroxylase
MHADIAIIGAGPAGLSLAGVLARKGLKIAIIDPASADDLEQPCDDGREIALTRLSRELLEQWRQWQLLQDTDYAPLVEAQVFDGTSERPMKIESRDGLEPLGWMVSNQALRRAAYAAAKDLDGIAWHLSRRMNRIDINEDAARVELDDGSCITARLTIAADSRFSSARRAAGLSARMHDFGRTMLVCRMQLQKPVSGVAWEWLDYGQTLALLPLNVDLASVVITLPPAETERLCALPVHEFEIEVERHFWHRLGSMRLIGNRYPYPLVGVRPDNIVSKRFACIGDAAIGMHPITAHGYNLGLRGIALLGDRIQSALDGGKDFAGNDVLSGFQAEFMAIARPLYFSTLSIVRLYSDDRAPAKLLRRAGLRFGQHFPPFKKQLVSALSGKDVRPPAALRILGSLLAARTPRA